VVGRGLPGAVEVVSLDIVEIELLRDRGQLNVGKVLLARRSMDSTSGTGNSNARDYRTI
jgi:hypothetical protein